MTCAMISVHRQQQQFAKQINNIVVAIANLSQSEFSVMEKARSAIDHILLHMRTDLRIKMSWIRIHNTDCLPHISQRSSPSQSRAPNMVLPTLTFVLPTSIYNHQRKTKITEGPHSTDLSWTNSRIIFMNVNATRCNGRTWRGQCSRTGQWFVNDNNDHEYIPVTSKGRPTCATETRKTWDRQRKLWREGHFWIDLLYLLRNLFTDRMFKVRRHSHAQL